MKDSKKYLCILIAVGALGVTARTVQAGSSEGVVALISSDQKQVINFAVAGGHSNKPACSTIGEQWSIPLDSAAGWGMYAQLLVASETGRTVSVVGTGLCDGPQANRETVKYLAIFY